MIRLSNNRHCGLLEDKMKYVNNPQKLLDVINTLAQHQAVIKEYFFASLNPRVNTLSEGSDKITRLFIIADADRQGKGKGNINVINATASFKRYLYGNSFKDLHHMEAREAHREFLKTMCDIKGMDQKTANLFLKYLVTFQAEFKLALYNWKSWEHYLDVPIDLWVLRLLGNKYLNICNEEYEKAFYHKVKREDKNEDKYEYSSPNYLSPEYIDLQTDIKNVFSQVTHPAITLDGLWFVGSKFCLYKPLLCNSCWLKNYCIADQKVRWPEEKHIKSKTESKEIRKETLKENAKIMKAFSKIQISWKAANPGKSDDEFLRFLRNVSDGGNNTPNSNA